MTIKEAMEFIKTTFAESAAEAGEEEKREAFDMCIDALKRNEKRKPIMTSYSFIDKEADGYPGYDSYECPNCGKKCDFYGDHRDYCPGCGQALDWSFEKKSSAVEFVSYDGEFPNPCDGTLVLRIDGKEVEILTHCLLSTGTAYCTEHEDVVEYGDWVVVDIPCGYGKYSNEINKCVNEHVRHGCCGRCI